ncbi:bacterial translation initiation factor 2 (bIF-2) [Olsenella uli DSM 7084]|uniref:Translation initiation factor IF-2 n=2 Tax=Olsenella uli TaxID=133926 RepID=E1QVG1_OLSUV|nr:translation initiation factor IF-2 [Olsenella uli]ADK68114.1 bacterial translation initiation factor 2 (bIF-2) [Olsenella uli DSM 7084]KRO13089.1 translation initiation factor 2 (bIF-2) [Olsenella uli DSM 7084]
MAKTRVHDLAKEYGMTSKEMLGHLADMKIPAKSPSSTLEDAYVSIVRKKLKPILEARAAEIEAAKRAEAEAEAERERVEAEKAERERIEAEARRERERAEEERKRAAAEAARKRAEEERLEAERLAAEEAERNRVKDTAPKSVPSFTSLLDQIAQQEKVLQQQAEEASKKKDEARGGKRDDQHRPRRSAAPRPSEGAGAPSPGDEGRKGRGRGRKTTRRGGQEEDRYSRMAREAEEYNRSHVLEEARVAVEEATRESTGRRKKRKERRKQQAEQAAEQQRIEEAIANDQDVSQLDTVRVPQGSTVTQLAGLLGVPANDIIKRLFLLGTPLTLTESMSDELIELVADDLGRDVKVMTKEEENSFTFFDNPEDLVSRPPVVTVMGHVDHGKTSLLDAIRHTGVAAGEAGGITQAIGASQVKINGRIITFIDTPGHETFTAMRARGAKVTDIVILIVAADDGVMPQTIESINHAKAAGVPIIVAVNKIDKPGADPTRVRQELTEYGVIPEEWGGENMFVDISARQNQGIDTLLESVLLEADVLELKANPDTFASGNVLEAKLDRGRGSVATLLVSRGTLHVGDAIVAGLAFGKIRAMVDPRGNSVTEAGPADPVEVLGLSSVPMAGDEFRVFQDERDARGLAEQRQLKARIEEQNRVKHVTLENLFDTMADADVKELNLIIKADVQGSIEALQDSLDKMDQSEVRINTIHSAVGAISETDVVLADASNAIIIGFGVRPEAKARTAAEQQGVEIRTYSVIYKAIEDIDAARIGMLKPTEEERQTASVEVRNTFKVPKVGIAAGCMVQDGEVSRDDLCRLVRDGIVVYEGRLASLRRFKDDVKTVKAGFECGVGLENFQDIHVGDIIEAYRVEQVARTE